MILTETVAINENVRREQSVDTNANTPNFYPTKNAKAVTPTVYQSPENGCPVCATIY
jgi:hypothetical protein